MGLYFKLFWGKIAPASLKLSANRRVGLRPATFSGAKLPQLH